jgi:hypothetical protein
MTDSTQLTTASGYNVSRMIFSEPVLGSIPDSKPAICYRRISISTKNEDGTVGDLIFPTSELFSFGVSENINKETGKVNGYVQPLCLHNRDGPTADEKSWVDTFNKVIDHCKNHLVENKESIEQWELSLNDLKKFNPLYYRREKGKIVEGTGPTLYAKLIVSRKQDKIVSMYFDYNGESVNPLELVGKYCFARSAIKIESIFIGNKISMQVKLYETEVKLMETGMKRLMSKPKSQPRVLNSQNNINPLMSGPPGGLKHGEEKEDYDDDGAGSIGGSDDEKTVSQADEKKKVVVKKKRVVKKVIRDEAE